MALNDLMETRGYHSASALFPQPDQHRYHPSLNKGLASGTAGAICSRQAATRDEETR
jgi:hypothetical protein